MLREVASAGMMGHVASHPGPSTAQKAVRNPFLTSLAAAVRALKLKISRRLSIHGVGSGSVALALELCILKLDLRKQAALPGRS